MRKAKCVLSFALTIVLMCSIGVVAFAAASPAPDLPESRVQSSEDASGADEWAGEELPGVIDINPGDDDAAAADYPDEQQTKNPQEPPAEKTSSNTPYLVGAVLAVTMFLGVAVFCKFKGNR